MSSPPRWRRSSSTPSSSAGLVFAASHYGLPDIGFIAWPDIVAFTQRLRAVSPRAHIIVDIDDGYCDVEVAAYAVGTLESVGRRALSSRKPVVVLSGRCGEIAAELGVRRWELSISHSAMYATASAIAIGTEEAE